MKDDEHCIPWLQNRSNSWSDSIRHILPVPTRRTSGSLKFGITHDDCSNPARSRSSKSRLGERCGVWHAFASCLFWWCYRLLL